METCYITHKVVETVSCDSSCAVEVDSMKAFHYFSVIRNLKIGYERLAVFLHLDVFGIVLSYRHTGVDDVRNCHHYLLNLLLKLFLELFKLCQTLCLLSDLLFNLFCLFTLALCHKSAYLLGKTVSFSS